VVAARSENAESEEEKSEHFSDESDSSVSGRVDVWEYSIGVERIELSRGFPKGNAEHGAARSSDYLRHGVRNPFNDEVIVSVGNGLPSENGAGHGRVDVTARNTSDCVDHEDQVARSANWHCNGSEASVFSGDRGHRNGV